MKLPDDSAPKSASVEWRDAKNQVATVEAGSQKWAIDDATKVTITENADGSVTFAPADPVVLGTCQLSVSADADLGSGVVPVTALLDIEVVAGQAVVGTINVNP